MITEILTGFVFITVIFIKFLRRLMQSGNLRVHSTNYNFINNMSLGKNEEEEEVPFDIKYNPHDISDWYEYFDESSCECEKYPWIDEEICKEMRLKKLNRMRRIKNKKCD
jgi:hypothetical protein